MYISAHIATHIFIVWFRLAVIRVVLIFLFIEQMIKELDT